MPMLLFIKRCLLTFLAFIAVVPPLTADDPSNRNVRFGMPTPAKEDPRRHDDYLIERSQFVLSYNDKLRRPNWVSWSLRRDDIGKSMRGPFEPDPLLPKGFARVTSQVYNGSGFDRGRRNPKEQPHDRGHHAQRPERRVPVAEVPRVSSRGREADGLHVLAEARRRRCRGNQTGRRHREGQGAEAEIW